jgi:aspartate racemase
MRKPCIGILAGMGPRSTAPFVDMLVDECVRQYGAKQDMDFPAMLVYSLPTPYYTDRPFDHAAMKSAIMAGLGELAGFGVDFIAMPCNTAHLYFEELKDSVSVPLLDMVGETVAAVPPESRGAALFATQATAESGLYQRCFSGSGKKLLYQAEWQDVVDGLIGAVKREGASPANKEKMRELLSVAARAGADCAVIACTDLTPVSIGCGADITIVDSALCLARATVARYVEMKGTANK